MKDCFRNHHSALWSARRSDVVRVLVVLLVALGSTRAQAATFTVNSTTDAVDANPGNGVCLDGSGHCTLRAAIMEANALPGGDIITLPAGTYLSTIPGLGEDAAATGDLDITGDLTINGAGAATTIIDGNGAALFDRVVHVLAGTVAISNVTIRGGSTIFGGGGAGISNLGILTLSGSTITGNKVSGGGANDNGGGILNQAGAQVTVSNSTISGNSLIGFRFGGGIANFGTGVVDSSTITGNSTTGSGGGISNGGTFTLTNATVSGNSASGSGGGMEDDGIATVSNSTLSGNAAAGGGGLFVFIGSASLRNTIVANSASGGSCQLNGTLTSNGFNLSSDASCAFSAPGDLNSVNPLLGALANNGGATLTHALLPGSPAIDVVPPASCAVGADQRGVGRPQGVACDIGAYETSNAPTPTATASATAVPTATVPGMPIACVGDCNGDGVVTINELILMVNIALSLQPVSACPAGDANHDGNITIAELITAVNNDLFGCPCGFTAPRMCGGACPNVTDVCQPLPDDSGCVCRPAGPSPTSTATVSPRATPTRTPPVTSTGTSTPTSQPSATATNSSTRPQTPSSTPTSTATPSAPATATATGMVGPSCVPTPSNMVAWWALDEPAGATTVVDIGLPPANNGVPQAGPISAAGSPLAVPGNLVTNPPDGALLFFQPSTYVDVPPSNDLDLASSSLTIDAWVLPTEVHPVLPGAVDILEPIVDKLGSGNTGYALYLQITATCPACTPLPPFPPGTQQSVVMRLVFAVGSGTYQSTPIYTGTFGVNPQVPLAPPWPGWLHIAVTVDRTAGNVGQFYLNGSSAGSFTPVVGVNSTTSFWIGGTRRVPVPIAFHGEIEINELEVFNVALAQPQIQAIAGASAGKCKNVTPVATSTATPPRSPTATATRSSTATVTPTRPTSTATRTPTRVTSPTSTSTATRTRTGTASFTPRSTSTPTATPHCEEGRSLLVSTGNASIGANDPIWSLVGAPAGTANFPPARPAVVISAYGGWSTIQNTQWITANPVCGQTTGCPAGTYEYELCWEQCGELVDPMPFMVLADNRANVFLDNTFLIAAPGFSVPTSFGFTTGPGTHSLRVDVINDLFSGAQTPTGLDLSGVLTGQIDLVPCQVRPPTFTATPTSTGSAVSTATRTPTATRTATGSGGANVTVLKNTVPDGPQDFSFTASGGLVPAAFMLDDDNDPTLPNAQLFTNVPNGTYTITELVPPGWMVTSIGCVGAIGISTGVSSATITVQAGANVTCTFKNEPQPTPTVIPTVTPTPSRTPTNTVTRTPTKTPNGPPPD